MLIFSGLLFFQLPRTAPTTYLSDILSKGVSSKTTRSRVREKAWLNNDCSVSRPMLINRLLITYGDRIDASCCGIIVALKTDAEIILDAAESAYNSHTQEFSRLVSTIEWWNVCHNSWSSRIHELEMRRCLIYQNSRSVVERWDGGLWSHSQLAGENIVNGYG